MWLITSLIAAGLVTLLWAIAAKKYKLEYLALMLWGLTIMILVDHILGYEGGPFIEFETDGLITNSTVLGIVMLIPIFCVWGLKLAFNKK